MQTFQEILRKLNERSSHFLKYPLEVYINHLTQSIPIPPRAFYKISIQILDSDKLQINPPPPNELPLCDVSFIPLANCLSPENVIKAINYIMLERRVLFVSNRIEILSPVMEAMLALMYPFEYQMIYIPVVPYNLVDILQTSCVYLLGIHRSLYDKYGSYINSSVCIVDLDNNTVNYNEVFWIQSNLALVEKQIKIAVIP